MDSLGDYEWPITQPQGPCEDCGIIRPLRNDLCRCCTRDLEEKAEDDAYRKDELQGGLF